MASPALDSPPVQIVMVCTAFGMDSADYTVPYVASWSSSVEGQSPVEVVRATGDRVRATALRVLDGLPEPPVGEGTPPGWAGLLADRPARDREPGRRNSLSPTAARQARICSGLEPRMAVVGR